MWEERVDFIFQLTDIMKRSQGRDSSRGHRVLLTGFALPGLISLLSYRSDHLFRDGTTYSGLDPTPSIINQESAPIDVPKGQFYGGIFSGEVHYSQMC